MSQWNNFRDQCHIGLRITKTGIAVGLSLFLSELLHLAPFFAMIASVICMKTDTSDSIKVGRNRVLGTVVGGLSGMAMLYGFQFFQVQSEGLLYSVLSVVVLMLVIKGLALFSKEGAVIIACVVYLSVLYMNYHDMTIFAYSMTRVLETLLGVLVAIVVNHLLPNHRQDDCAK